MLTRGFSFTHVKTRWIVTKINTTQKEPTESHSNTIDAVKGSLNVKPFSTTINFQRTSDYPLGIKVVSPLFMEMKEKTAMDSIYKAISALIPFYDLIKNE